MALYTLIVACLVTSARSHGRLTKPMSRFGPGYQNNPVPGYNSDAFVCRVATKNPSIETTEITAGGELTLQWDFGAAHVGDCAVYISYDVSSDRAAQKYFKIANLPRCKDQNRQDVKISLPEFLPAGDAVLRWDWYALHVFPTVEFYSQCVDVKITSTSSLQANQLETYSIISPAVYPANGNTGKGFRNPYGNGEQFMTGPACAHGYTGNNCGLTAVGTRGNTREGGDAIIGGGNGGETTTTGGVTVTLTPLCEIYTVVAGDTLASIADQYTQQGKAVTWQRICAANSKADCNAVDVGDNYIIPYAGSACVGAGETTTTEPLATTTAVSQPPLCEIYSRVAGNSLSTIADDYASQCQGLTREQICANANTDCSQCSPAVQHICTVTSNFVQQICAATPLATTIGSSTAALTTGPISSTSSQSPTTTESSIESPTTELISSTSSQSTTSTAGPILSTSSQSGDIGSTTDDLIAVIDGACMLLLSPVTVFALIAGNWLH